MDEIRRPTGDTSDDTPVDSNDALDFGFLPESLRTRSRSLIESYHGLHGFGCLPNMLWKAGLGPFIETNREFRQLLRKASTTRSAKKSSESFAQIATTLLSLEILASDFAGWSKVFPQAASVARSILKLHRPLAHMALLESYLYPPKHLSSAAIAALALPHDSPFESAGANPGHDSAGHAAWPETTVDEIEDRRNA